MKIDSHQHFWKFDPIRDSWINDDMAVLRADFMPSDLYSLLATQHIDGCIAVQADQSEKETDFLLKLAEENTWIRGVVGWLDIRATNIEAKLERYSSYPKLVGLRHIVQAEPDRDFLLDPEFCRGISLLKKYDLAYDILVYHHQLPQVLNFVERFHDQVFVLDHLAKPQIKDREIDHWKRNIEELAKYPNVYCKFSGMTTEDDWANSTVDSLRPYAEVVIDAFDNRLLFGSDWPVCLLAGSYEKWCAMAEELISSFNDRQKFEFWGGTAKRVYKLK